MYAAFFPAVRVVVRPSFPGGRQRAVWVRRRAVRYETGSAYDCTVLARQYEGALNTGLLA